MKKISQLLIIVFLVFTVNAQRSAFVIKGQLEKGKNGQLFVGYPDGDDYIRDSTPITDGAFVFRGNIHFPTLIGVTYIPPEGIPRNMTMEQFWAIDTRGIFIDGKNISIKGNTLKTAIIQGAGQTHKEYEQYERYLQPWKDSLRTIERAYGKARREKNEEEIKKQDAAMHEKMAAIEEAENRFIVRHPDSYVSLNIISERKNNNRTESMAPMLKVLSKRLQDSPEGLSIRKKLSELASIEIGKPAPEFTQDDDKGKPVSLTSLKGKYVLIDFWASWCGPCRLENPNVVKAYNEFKDKGFEILGVSLDHNRENWLNAIKKDGLTWLHVSDLKGWQNVVAEKYNIKSVPANVLVDPSGIIIARDLHGDKLRETLEGVLTAQSQPQGRQKTVTY